MAFCASLGHAAMPAIEQGSARGVIGFGTGERGTAAVGYVVFVKIARRQPSTTPHCEVHLYRYISALTVERIELLWHSVHRWATQPCQQ